MRWYIRSRTGLQQRAKERGCHNPIAHHKGGEGKSRRLYHWLELPKRMRRGHHCAKLSLRAFVQSYSRLSPQGAKIRYCRP